MAVDHGRWVQFSTGADLAAQSNDSEQFTRVTRMKSNRISFVRTDVLKAKRLHLVCIPVKSRSRIPPCRNEKSSTQTSKLLSNSWILANLRHWGWQLDSSQWCLFLVWLFSPVPFACRTQFKNTHVHWIYRSFCYHYYGQPVWMCSDREQCAIKNRQQYAQGTMCNYILKKYSMDFYCRFYIFRIASTHPSIWVSCRCSFHAMVEIL